MSSAELVEVKKQLAKLYTAQDSEDTEVRVTLYQIMEASMNISTSLSAAAVCEVFMEALTLDGYGATCTAAVSGDKSTFTRGCSSFFSCPWSTNLVVRGLGRAFLCLSVGCAFLCRNSALRVRW